MSTRPCTGRTALQAPWLRVKKRLLFSIFMNCRREKWSLSTLSVVTFCQQHLISSGTLRDSCNTLSSLHTSSSSVHRHYHTVILTTSVKTICELTATYQRSDITRVDCGSPIVYATHHFGSFRELEVGAKRKQQQQQREMVNIWQNFIKM